MKKKTIVILVVSFVFLLAFTYPIYPYFIAPLIPRSPTQIIAIPGGQEYISYSAGSELAECFVVINPPRNSKKVEEFAKLIMEYDKANPIIAPPPPEDTEYVRGYRRDFFRESKTFPKDIKFTSNFRPDDILTEEYNLRDRIAYVEADKENTRYHITLYYGESTFWDVRETARYDVELTSEPSVNGLYDNVPENMTPLK